MRQELATFYKRYIYEYRVVIVSALVSIALLVFFLVIGSQYRFQEEISDQPAEHNLPQNSIVADIQKGDGSYEELVNKEEENKCYKNCTAEELLALASYKFSDLDSYQLHYSSDKQGSDKVNWEGFINAKDGKARFNKLGDETSNLYLENEEDIYQYSPDQVLEFDNSNIKYEYEFIDKDSDQHKAVEVKTENTAEEYLCTFEVTINDHIMVTAVDGSCNLKNGDLMKDVSVVYTGFNQEFRIIN